MSVKPLDKMRPDKPCTTHSNAAGTDLALGIGAGLVGGLAAALFSESGDATLIALPLVTGGAIGAAAITSGVYGLTKTAECREHYRSIGKRIPESSGGALGCFGVHGPGVAGLVVGGLLCAGAAAVALSEDSAMTADGSGMGVQRSCRSGGKPMARCHDGTLWCADSIRGACRSHGGVHKWLD
ncbi:MAG: hypothetical protein ACPGU1_19260 [Myxococcota bacterium]